MRLWISIVFGIVLVAAVLGFLWLQPLQSTDVQPPPVTTTTEAPVQNTTAVEGAVLETDVLLTAQFFEPSEITIEAGDTLTLVVRSVDRDHAILASWNSERSGAPLGSDTRITFKPQVTGTQSLICVDQCEGDVELSITVR